MILDAFDCHPDHPVGGKARALASLSKAGFKVPKWLVVTPGPFNLPRLEGLHAVRSSALAEDGATSSFAGQFESHLNISPENIPDSIEKVRKSARSERLETYAETKGHPSEQQISVIVQEMIDARFAGVAFGADPVSGERDLTLVSAVAGLGEKLVSGEVDSENWRINRSDTIEGESKLLSSEQILAITHLARQCNAHFGSPQDIEWAIDQDGALWLLQSRPITTLAKLPDPADELTVWDNSNIAESYGGITGPLTYSFATRIYEHVYREFCKLLGVPAWKIARSEQVFPRMLGHIRGHVYYNLVSWYRVLALLPGFSVNRSFMEQMMGVKKPLPDEIVSKIIAENTTSKWRDSLALLKSTLGLIRSYLFLPRQIRTFQKRLNKALELETPLSRLRSEELVSHFHELEKKLLHRWDAPLVNDFFAMIFYGILAKRTNNPNSFLQNTGDIVSARPARLIKEMARLVQPDEHLGNLLVSDISTPLKISEVRKHPELNRKFTEYLQEFGDRCLEELKLESPTLIDDPGSLLTSIGSFALRFEEEGAETTSASEHQGVGKVPFLHRLLINKTRILLRNRENLRFERTRLFGRVRGIMRELGARLQADQQIKAIDDIFYLTLDEVLETSRTRPLMSLVETRKREFEKYRNGNPPPDRVITRGPLHRYKTFKADQPVSVQSPADLQGIGACPGIVRGPVRVVTDPRQASLKKGEILVASQTDPGWIILFPAASGLLVERGSLLSHSAIVARELNLPCIVSLANITTTLKTGDQIEMNGQSGQVTLLQADP